MRKLFFLLFAACSILAAHAQSCVNVRQISTNYGTKQITFDLTWGTCNNTNHLYRVWVFVDYQPVTGLIKGAWSRAAIANSNVGTLHNNSGVWVTGSAGATQRVTLTLNVSPTQFNWCAYATDCPPNAVKSNGTYTLKGSLPFIINGTTTISAKTYTGNISTITDATNNPEGFVYDNTSACIMKAVYLGSVGFTSTKTWVVGSQTWSAPVTATYCRKTSFDGGTATAYKADCRANNGSATTVNVTYGDLFSWCMVNQFKTVLCPSGWRVPSNTDFCTLDKSLNNRSNCSNRVISGAVTKALRSIRLSARRDGSIT